VRSTTTLKISILTLMLATPGCRDGGLVDLARAGDSAAANRMIVHLPGFDAVAEERKDGGKSYFQLRLPRERHFAALSQLHELGLLPRARPDWVELLPRSVFDRLSVDAESAGIDFVHALAAEDALLQLAWVRDVRVVVAPSPLKGKSEEGPPGRQAAVVMVHDGTESEESVRTVVHRVVAGAVEGIDAEGDDVFVVMTLERTPRPAPTWLEEMSEEEVAAIASSDSKADTGEGAGPGGLIPTALAGLMALLLLGQTLWVLHGRKREIRRRAAAVAPSVSPAS